ncbi:MAG: hypothetical protein AAF639_23785 [Chloroflexota bacterium]
MYHTFDNDQLVDELARLKVPFLRGGTDNPSNLPIPPATFICALAASNEARVRLALIPLFLQRPEYAAYVPHAYRDLSGNAQLVLTCYYTASHFLQKKYHSQLEIIHPVMNWLPDLFSNELEISSDEIDDGLQALDERHKELSGRKINWLGTYEHGVQKLLKFLKKTK